MPDEHTAERPASQTAEAQGPLMKLIARTKRTEDPAKLLDLCLEGGKPLLEERPNLPRHVLSFARKAEDQDKADATRIRVARHFPEILGLADLQWLQRLGLQEEEAQAIRRILAGDQVTGQRRVNLITRLLDLKQFDTLSEALDAFASQATDDPTFYAAHCKSLAHDRRREEAKEVLKRFRERYAGTDHDHVIREITFALEGADADPDWLPENASEMFQTAVRLGQIGKELLNGESDQIDGWRLLEGDIIYRPGTSDTALVLFVGPQSVKNAKAWARVIAECDRLGIGQVLLSRRLDRNLTGLGPWKGRPEETTKALARALEAVGIRRIATAGSSGSTLAATIGAAAIDADGAFLMPAVTHFPDPDEEPNPRAARAAAREYRHLPPGIYDAKPFLQGKSVLLWAHLPEQSEFDRRQIEHLADYPHLHVVRHDHGAHGILPWLAEKNILEAAVSDFFKALGWIDG
ncbi:hypothetical protein [Tropicimonas sediminicola]|uniref:Uncharacterized protein n=1 Tax=Tropicimonas sediminicola TaxID=1031541 RepID=A0A239J964_9RHOB|nr:hypothetical protein [Tropicimonas sediminicola]SNT01184.1 hypothetical protein SAMN05421757_105116 [Tropicimonas sediminicola]